MMKRRLRLATASAFLLGLAGCRGLVNGSGVEAGNKPNPQLNQNVNHIIFMIQENRSFDHYFGHLNAYRVRQGLPADVDGAPSDASNPAANGVGTVAPFHLTTQCVEKLSPSWNETHTDINATNPPTSTLGPTPMDGFVKTAAKFATDTGLSDTQGLRSMGYFDEREIPFYYFMATQFATSDRWFSPVPSRTQPNRMFAIAASSDGLVYPPKTGTDRLTIFDVLQKAGVSWRVYAVGLRASTLEAFPIFDAHPEGVVPMSQFFSDVASGSLPSVAFIDTGFENGEDEHPPAPIQPGAAQVARFVNALMSSPSWKDSVFILTFDEGGGFYDHVPPMPTVNPDGIKPQDLLPTDIQGDFTFSGFRVPVIVISPFSKAHYVSHLPMDYTAILKLIETRFSLPNLTARDASQPDMSTEFFDFEGAPWRNPPRPPAQPTDAPCYFDHLP
jgi:phospholipase C